MGFSFKPYRDCTNEYLVCDAHLLICYCRRTFVRVRHVLWFGMTLPLSSHSYQTQYEDIDLQEFELCRHVCSSNDETYKTLVYVELLPLTRRLKECDIG